MTPKQFAKFVARDKYCLHCGDDGDTLIPQHRINRGMGGSKRLDTASNIIVMCSLFNGLIESSGEAARAARVNGWKLSSWDNPVEVPVYDTVQDCWWVLDDSFNRILFIE